jgi:starvation-inducible outer membrane lipoprotein
MAARVTDVLALISCLTALALAGCSTVSDPAGFAIASQDRYDFMTCKEIINHRSTQTGRMKRLGEAIEKAEASPGGFIVAAAAYRSEYTEARALAAAAERAARLNNCEPAKPN